MVNRVVGWLREMERDGGGDAQEAVCCVVDSGFSFVRVVTAK